MDIEQYQIEKKLSRVLISLLAVVFFYIIAMGSAIIFLAIKNWADKGDILAFLFESIPLSVLLFLGLIVFTKLTLEWNIVFKYLGAIVSGIAIGYYWTFCISIFIGNWFYFFSFPVLLSWILGTLGSFLFAVLIQHPKSWLAVIAIFSLAIMLTGYLYVDAMKPAQQIVIYLNQDITSKMERDFWSEYICLPTGVNEECSLREGVSGARSSYDGGYSLIVLSFWRNVSDEEISSVKEIISTSPNVYKVE